MHDDHGVLLMRGWREGLTTVTVMVGHWGLIEVRIGWRGLGHQLLAGWRAVVGDLADYVIGGLVGSRIVVVGAGMLAGLELVGGQVGWALFDVWVHAWSMLLIYQVASLCLNLGLYQILVPEWHRSNLAGYDQICRLIFLVSQTAYFGPQRLDNSQQQFCLSTAVEPKFIISIIPLKFLAIHPGAIPLHSFLVPIGALAILLAVLPLAPVAAPVRPAEFAEALLLVVDVLALVLPAVRPDEDAPAVHFVVAPGALVLSPVHPDVVTETLNVVVLELSLVFAAVGPEESAMTFLESLMEVALVLSAIHPLLDSVAVLFVVQPFTSVGGTILMQIDALALSLVVDPLALIDITARVDKPTLPIGHVACPHSFVDGAIGPDLPTVTLFLIVTPLSLVDYAILQFPGSRDVIGGQVYNLEGTQLLIRILNSFGAVLGQFQELSGGGLGLAGEPLLEYEVDGGSAVLVLAGFAVAHV